MKHFAIKPAVLAILLAGSVAAQAAHLEYVGHLGFGGYSGSVAGESFADDMTDLSIGSEVAVYGARNDFSSVFADGSLNHGYANMAYYSAGDFMITAASFASFVATSAPTAAISTSLVQDSTVSLPGFSLHVAGDGEADGSPVQVSFAGQLDSLYSSLAGASHYAQIEFSVFNGSTIVSSQLWDLSDISAYSDSVAFSFLANVGDELTVSATISTGGTLEEAIIGAVGERELLASSIMLDGSFNVAAVPEPEQYAMFLAGLGLLGAAARRRKA